MGPVIKVSRERNSVCTGVLDVKFNTLLPLVYVRGLVVVFHCALLFWLPKKCCFLIQNFFAAFTRLSPGTSKNNQWIKSRQIERVRQRYQAKGFYWPVTKGTTF